MAQAPYYQGQLAAEWHGAVRQDARPAASNVITIALVVATASPTWRCRARSWSISTGLH